MHIYTYIFVINRKGILAFSAETRIWILFQTPYVTVVSPREAVVMLLFHMCIAFCVRPDGFVQIHISD